MKKMSALALAVVLLVAMASTALAYDEEIRWQDIPWGCSVGEVKYLLLTKGIVTDESEMSLENGYNQIFLMDADGSEIGFDVIDPTDPYVATITIDKPQFTVSGYAVERICLIFAKKDENDTRLITVGIAFSESGIYEDLQKTFTSVYGKAKTGKNFFGNEFITVEGANNTSVTLFKTSTTFNETLLYGKLDGLEIVESMIDPGSDTEEKTEVGL